MSLWKVCGSSGNARQEPEDETQPAKEFCANGEKPEGRWGVHHSREKAHRKPGYKAFEALDPFFKVVMEGLSELVDGKHYFDVFAEEDAIFESRYHFPG